jgi:hypothetical protein
VTAEIHQRSGAAGDGEHREPHQEFDELIPGVKSHQRKGTNLFCEEQ